MESVPPAAPAPVRPFLRAVSRGAVETFTCPDGSTLTSAVRKSPVAGAVRVLRSGVEGDATGHNDDGRPAERVHAFPWSHYPWFEARAGRALPVPLFGENLTVAGLDESDVRVGDRWRAGSVLLRVTQPTSRCALPGRSAGLPDLLSWIQEELRTGWYLEVEEEGVLRAGDAVEVVARGPASLSLARLNALLHRSPGDGAAAREVLAAPEVSAEWKRLVRRRHESATGGPPVD